MKKTKLSTVPVLIQLYPEDIHRANLTKELKIDKDNLDRELLRQPARYGFWSALYSVVSAKVAMLEERKEIMESDLFKRFKVDKGYKKVTDIKYLINRNQEFRAMKSMLRKWKDSERILKYAEKAFQQRLSVLMAVNANRRQDKKTENYREDEE